MKLDDNATAGWLNGVQRYVLASAAGHLVWEIFQLPLYTIWRDGAPGAQAFAIAHCTLGDVLIASASLTVAIVAVGKTWPQTRHSQLIVATLTIMLGLAYTVFSEWLNVEIRKTWAYTPSMPILPVLGTGLAPLLQWFIVPAMALKTAFRDDR